MKTTLVITALLLIAVFFGFKNPSKISKEISDLPPKDNQFLITAMHAGEVDPNYIHIPDLGLNAWHKYTGPLDFGWPGISNDNYLTPTADYEVAVKQRIDNNLTHGFRSIMDRPKIEYLAFGQKSEYQCEDVSRVDPDFWFYTYKTHNIGQDFQDTSQFGNNQWVRFCQVNPDNPGINSGYVVKDLRANREQANRYWPAWIADSAYKWYVMPKIRIPLNIPNSTPVCKIEVLDWDSNIVKSIVLTARQFKDINFNYSGNYMEEFYLIPNQDPIAIDITEGAMCPGDRRNFGDWVNVPISTDFRVYWYGQCDMWIDYVKVENQPAHELFKGQWDQQIREETDIALENYDPLNPIPNNFYIEEFEFNIVSAMSYVNNIIQQYDSRISLMVNLNYPLFSNHIPLDNNNHRDELSAEYVDKHLIKKANLKYLVNMSYPLEGFAGALYPVEDMRTSAHPNTLSQGDYNPTSGMLSYKVTPQVYENWLQDKLDFGIGSGGGFIRIMKLTDSLTKYLNNPDLRIIHLAQAHSWWANAHKLKEPSNEEINVMTNLSVSYGAKGIMYFAYGSSNESFNISDDNEYTRGLVNVNGTPRDSNVYGQNKWEGVKKINSTLNKWGSYLMSFENNERRSYIYRKPEERSQMLSDGQFMEEVFTYKPNTDGTANIIPEPINDRYLQIAFFTKHPWNLPYTSPESQYFMVTNRRCSPHYNNSSEDNIGGKRNVKVKISPFSLGFQKFRNVSLMDLGRDSILTTFYNENNINSDYTLDLGWFEPGEAKLFRIAPTLHMGGSLAANDTIYNVEFTCEGNVNTNGHIVYVLDSTTINFTSNGKINVNGGNFYVTGSYPSITFRGLNNQSWSGINLNTGSHAFSYVKFENTTVQAIKGENCDLVIQDCIFNINNNSKAVQINNSGSSIFDAYINNNKFNISNASATTCNLNANGGGQINAFIDNNQFNGNNNIGVAIYSNSGTGTIKNNIITNYKYGIYLSASSFDISGNNIYSTQINASGIRGVSLSGMNLGINSSKYITGGLNSLSITGTNSSDISVTNSTFNILNGYNTFNINSLTSYHLSGTFPSPFTRTYPDIDSRNNCFRYSNTFSSPAHSVLWMSSNNTPVNFIFYPYSCQIDVPDEESIITELSVGVTDTIYKAADYDSEEISTDQLLYDSLNLSLRKLDYENAMSTSKILLTNFGDSSSSTDLVLDAITKLYASTVSLDSLDHTNMIQLKTFFESLILNNPENIELISKTFYYLQKCKVVLGDYTSAISGFQQFIDQNPYSYEALVASWDLDATSLLDTLGGSGGGEKIIIDNSDLSQDEIMKSIYLMDDPKDKYDTKVFNKEDRKLIRENVYNSLNTTKNTRNKILKVLEVKVSEGTANQNEKREFENAKVLKELVKPKNPRTIEEHFNNVDNDINKILDLNNSTNLSSSSKSLIPTEYNLSQNYPNPFNPSTMISFDLPVDSKVKLIVYDMLGREVKSMVNTQLSIGRYEYQFEGSNFSSGIYFYRMEAVDNSGKKFVQTKRMVLVK